jgi:hypothetical protein
MFSVRRAIRSLLRKTQTVGPGNLIAEGDMARRRKSKNATAGLPALNADAAGIDIGATELYVAVPPDRDTEPACSFASFTEGLNALADWLL